MPTGRSITIAHFPTYLHRADKAFLRIVARGSEARAHVSPGAAHSGAIISRFMLKTDSTRNIVIRFRVHMRFVRPNIATICTHDLILYSTVRKFPAPRS